MSEIWVSKADGSIQCVPSTNTLSSLEDMRARLETLIGPQNVLDGEKRPSGGYVPAVCGMPTGNRNAYRITLEGLRLLFSGPAGPSGFEVDPQTKITGPGDDPIFPWPTKAESMSDDRWVPWPYAAFSGKDGEISARAFVNVIASLSTAGTMPSLITELLGRVARVYNEGDIVTLDYASQRVNIVLDEGRISRIWFG